MKNILVLHLNDGDDASTVRFLGEEINIRRIGCRGDAELVRTLIEANDGQVDAIGLEGYPAELELGGTVVPHTVGCTLPGVAKQTPVVDGGGIRPGLERWGVILADRAEPGIFAEKHVLLVAWPQPRRAGPGAEPPHLPDPLRRPGGLLCPARLSRRRQPAHAGSGRRPDAG